MSTKTRATSSARILIVDDEESNVVVLERLLHQAGYSDVFATTDSRSVVQLAKRISPDLMFFDLHMPDPSGFDLLEHFAGERPADGIYVPVIVLTADVTPGTKLKALALGASDFVTKPFERTELLLRTRNLLETRFLYRELAEADDRYRDLKLRLFDAEQSNRLLIDKLARLGEYSELQIALHP